MPSLVKRPPWWGAHGPFQAGEGPPGRVVPAEPGTPGRPAGSHPVGNLAPAAHPPTGNRVVAEHPVPWAGRAPQARQARLAGLVARSATGLVKAPTHYRK